MTKYRIVLLNYGSDLDLVSIDGESRIQDADDYDVVLAKDHDRALTAAQQRISDLERHNSILRDWCRDPAEAQKAIDAAMAAKGDDWLTREARQIGLHSPACASFGQNECDCWAAWAAREAE